MIQPWSKEEQEREGAIARQLFRCGDFQHTTDMEREHCGACVLRGFVSESARTDGWADEDGPNYAGWARTYVQARIAVPARWLPAFARELQRTDNKLYTEALQRDIATWGVRFQ